MLISDIYEWMKTSVLHIWLKIDESNAVKFILTVVSGCSLSPFHVGNASVSQECFFKENKKEKLENNIFELL